MTKQQLWDKMNEMTPSCTGAEDFVEQYNGYICDAISEIADNNVDIYNSDLTEWANGNSSYIEEAISEFGWDGCGKDYFKAIQMGQFLSYEQELYDNLKELVLAYALRYACQSIDFDKFAEMDSEDFIDEIKDRVYSIDNNNTFDDIEEIVDEYIEELTEEPEEDEPEL